MVLDRSDISGKYVLIICFKYSGNVGSCIDRKQG